MLQATGINRNNTFFFFFGQELCDRRQTTPHPATTIHFDEGRLIPEIETSKEKETRMAAVYKSLAKTSSKADKMDIDEDSKSSGNGVRKNKQRVLILSSRGVTHRFVTLLRKRRRRGAGGLANGE